MARRRRIPHRRSAGASRISRASENPFDPTAIAPAASIATFPAPVSLSCLRRRLSVSSKTKASAFGENENKKGTAPTDSRPAEIRVSQPKNLRIRDEFNRVFAIDFSLFSAGFFWCEGKREEGKENLGLGESEMIRDKEEKEERERESSEREKRERVLTFFLL